MLRNLSKLLYICLLTQFFCEVVSGGICWLLKDRNDFCKVVYKMNTSKEDCCNLQISTVSIFTYWTPDNLRNQKLFFMTQMGPGVPNCQSCHASCKTVKCGKDKTCVMRQGRPKCACMPKCDHKLRRRGKLCGTDGQVYRHYCSLLKYNCRRGQNVNIAYFGTCQKSCKTVKCYGPMSCLEDQYSLPNCAPCKLDCPKPTPRDSPLCGEDGITYPSVCHLEVATCRSTRSVRLAYRGPCRENGTCNNTVCDEGKSCLLNPNTGGPICYDCRKFCKDAVLSRVCGTDGHTYTNYCSLHASACRKGLFIRTKHIGLCRGERPSKVNVSEKRYAIEFSSGSDNLSPYMS